MKVSQLDQACSVCALLDFTRKFIFRGLCSILAAKQAEFIIVLAQGTTLEGCAIDAMMVELAEELVGADND